MYTCIRMATMTLLRGKAVKHSCTTHSPDVARDLPPRQLIQKSEITDITMCASRVQMRSDAAGLRSCAKAVSPSMCRWFSHDSSCSESVPACCLVRLDCTPCCCCRCLMISCRAKTEHCFAIPITLGSI